MDVRFRNLVWVWLLAFAAWSSGCNCVSGDPLIPETTTDSSSTTTTEDLPCGMDCSKIATPQCTTAVCNTGQVVGPLNSCVVVPVPLGTGCDDGQFCTINDACDAAGTCVGKDKNICGLAANPCVAVVCYEESHTCDSQPVNDGTECTPTDKCQVSGICELGECKGEPKDCSFSPLAECNSVGCDPATGLCAGVPDPDKEDTACVLTGDPCAVGKTCKAGACQGGSPKDCSALDVGCEIGACDGATGICKPTPAPPGTICTEGIHDCDVGACDNKGICVASPAPNGIACNDHNSCTKGDKCQTGVCDGAAVAGCDLYLNSGFESCPGGWTLGGDWECGVPTDVGPTDAHTGNNVIATQIAGFYHANQSYNTTVADSPPINLTTAVNPVLSFWAWVWTEGNTFDGFNLKASIDNGATFSTVTSVTPAYPLNVLNQAAWGGNHSVEGWQPYSADLTAYIGHNVILRFAFRSDGATVFPGVYIDDVVVAEPVQSPLYITTPSALPDDYSEMAYSTQIAKTGGTAGSVWSIKPGGVNAAWLTIDPATGVLSGTPALANNGPVTVTVHVEEPTLPSNYADKTFHFTVSDAKYFTSFEGVCPNGWTLTGDWQCGAPSNGGPGSAYAGSQCMATQIAGPYSDNQVFANTTATSPSINLGAAANPKLTFRMWVDTEGATYDGFNLQISTDGGNNFGIVNTAVPPYPLVISGKPAWGGHQAALGWQLVEVDLTAYAGQTIKLRYAFQSDNSGSFPGVYIDDILVN